MNKCEICIIEKKNIYIYTSLSCKELNQLYWFKSFHIYTLLPNLEASFSFAIYQIRFKTHNQQHAHHEVLYTSHHLSGSTCTKNPPNIGFLTGSQGGLNTMPSCPPFWISESTALAADLAAAKRTLDRLTSAAMASPLETVGGSMGEADIHITYIYICLMVSEHADCMPCAKTYQQKHMDRQTTMIS